MIFLIAGIILFAIFNVLGLLFVRKTAAHIAIEKRIELSKLYSELNKYFVSAIVVFCVMTLFILKKLQANFIALSSGYLSLSLVALALLCYWLFVEMSRREYKPEAIKLMIYSSAMKNLSFVTLIFGISQYLNKLNM